MSVMGGKVKIPFIEASTSNKDCICSSIRLSADTIVARHLLNSQLDMFEMN